jgi:hypothetical protein
MTKATWKNEYKCNFGTTENVMGASDSSQISNDMLTIISMDSKEAILQIASGDTETVYFDLDIAKESCDSGYEAGLETPSTPSSGFTEAMVDGKMFLQYRNSSPLGCITFNSNKTMNWTFKKDGEIIN